MSDQDLILDMEELVVLIDPATAQGSQSLGELKLRITELKESLTSEKKVHFVCPFCGTSEVQALEWINPNTDAIVGGNIGNGEPDSHWWCPDCGTNIKAVSPEQWEELPILCSLCRDGVGKPRGCRHGEDLRRCEHYDGPAVES